MSAGDGFGPVSRSRERVEPYVGHPGVMESDFWLTMLLCLGVEYLLHLRVK